MGWIFRTDFEGMRIAPMDPGMACSKQDWKPQYASTVRLFAHRFARHGIFSFCSGNSTLQQIQTFEDESP